jgi:hypothetical protein
LVHVVHASMADHISPDQMRIGFARHGFD